MSPMPTITGFGDYKSRPHRPCPDNAQPRFGRPIGIAASQGYVYVSDFLLDTIYKFKEDGTFLTQWGKSGSDEGQFDGPDGLAVDGQGKVYVADFYNHRNQKFDEAGEFILQWGRNGKRGGRFHYPTDVTVDQEGTVYVADAYNHRIQKFGTDGRYLMKWGGLWGFSGRWKGWFKLAKAIASGPDGNIYVADAFNHRIQKFNTQGDFLTLWGELGSGPGQIHYAAGVALDSQGTVYVSDFFNNRIVKFLPESSISRQRSIP